MSEMPVLALSGVAGLALGGMFYGGLWWTIRRGLNAARPGLWFVASALLRMALALGGLYAVSGGDWQRLLACLLGFVAGRALVTWLTRDSEVSPANRGQEGERATQP